MDSEGGIIQIPSSGAISWRGISMTAVKERLVEMIPDMPDLIPEMEEEEGIKILPLRTQYIDETLRLALLRYISYK